jgi:hypothetical protein
MYNYIWHHTFVVLKYVIGPCHWLSMYGQLMCLEWHYGMPIRSEKASLLAPGWYRTDHKEDILFLDFFSLIDETGNSSMKSGKMCKWIMRNIAIRSADASCADKSRSRLLFISSFPFLVNLIRCEILLYHDRVITSSA